MADKKRKKKAHDFSVTAFRVVQEATEEKPPEKEQAKPPKTRDYDYKELGHRGGLKGGKARASKLTPEQRKEIAQKAARARWLKEKPTI